MGFIYLFFSFIIGRVFSFSKCRIWKLPTGEGAPERVGGLGPEWRGYRGNISLLGLGKAQGHNLEYNQETF